MTQLKDILYIADLNSHVAVGNIRAQVHPDFPELTIFNYTEQCTWNKAWDAVTLACRGLIVNTVTGEVLARPLTKFFNHDQEGAPTLTLDTPVLVTEKMDGSMGILYQTPDGKWAIATRGSFASEQALWATQFYNDHYANEWEPSKAFTHIFEIIYPENRIVVDYGSKRSLVFLAAVDKELGYTVQPHMQTDFNWPGEIVETLDFTTYGEVIASDQRSNKEGFVLWSPTEDWRVKIKHDEYVVLHRFMTNTSPKNIWEVLSTGGDVNETFALAPDEFHEWMKGVVADLVQKYNDIYRDAETDYDNIMATIVKDFTRAEFALYAIGKGNSGILFKMLDDKPVNDVIWKLIRPRGDEKMTVRVVNPDSD